jgi:hypothetical protein
MLRYSLDPSDSPEQAEAVVNLSLKYLRDVAIARLGTLELTAETVKLSMERELAMLDYVTLWTPDAIVEQVILYHKSKQDFPRPMGVLP